MELSFRKVIVLILISIVIIFVTIKSYSLIDFTKSSLSKLTDKENNYLDENSNQISKYISEYTFEKISSNSKTIKIDQNTINSFLSSNFYKNYHQVFEEFAKKNNFDVNLLYAIIITEIGPNPNIDFKKTIRFECHKFNQCVGEIKVDCACSNENYCNQKADRVYSTITSQTNYNAYLNGKKIDPKCAFKSTSFGFAQILGENLDYNKYKDIENLNSNQVQIEIFFDFIKNSGILKDLQKKDFKQIAKKYNGAKYYQSNYDKKIELAYNLLDKNNNVKLS